MHILSYAMTWIAQTFSFLDDGDLVKVYIPLEGPLAGVTKEHVDADFAERSLVVAVTPPGDTCCVYRFAIDRLAFGVDALRCKATVTKSGKLVLKLHKRNHLERWVKLRSA